MAAVYLKGTRVFPHANSVQLNCRKRSGIRSTRAGRARAPARTTTMATSSFSRVEKSETEWKKEVRFRTRPMFLRFHPDRCFASSKPGRASLIEFNHIGARADIFLLQRLKLNIQTL